eukprot:3005045-Alexandrium_andersonii.AAC.1
MADFPQLGSESQDESRKRSTGPRLAIPRAKSAKSASSSEGCQAPAEEAATLTYVKEAFKVADFGGSGDCGYRVLACMAA